jgi:hypothetical protein
MLHGPLKELITVFPHGNWLMGVAQERMKNATHAHNLCFGVPDRIKIATLSHRERALI